MMRVKIILFALVLVLFGCGHRTAVILDDVETYIQERPDSALATLRAIDTTTLTTKKLQAHYALLHAMALDKNWIDTTDVNVVMPAVRYYDRHPSGDRRAKAWYYLGRIQYNGHHFNDAIISFTRAGEYAERLTDDRFKALIFQATGDTYGSTYLPDEAYAYSEKAYEHALASGDSILANASLYRMAVGLNNLDRIEASDSLFRILLDRREQINPQTISSVLADYALMRVVKYSDCPGGVPLFEEAISLARGLPSVNHWCAYAYSWAAIGDQAKAEAIFDKLRKSPASDTYAYKIWWSKYLANKQSYESAYALLSESTDTQTEKTMEILRQSVVKAQRDLFSLEKTQAEESRRLIVWLSVISVLFLASAAFTGYLLLRRKYEKDREKSILLERENASLHEAVTSLSDKVTKMNVQRSQLQREYTLHLQTSFREWSQLYKAFFHTDGNGVIDSRDNVYYEAMKAMSRLSGDEEGQKMLESRLNELFDDVMIHYRSDFPNGTETDYHFVSFVFAGFEASVLKSAFRIPSLPATYERKSRLKDSILRSSSPHKEQYLRFFR